MRLDLNRLGVPAIPGAIAVDPDRSRHRKGVIGALRSAASRSYRSKLGKLAIEQDRHSASRTS